MKLEFCGQIFKKVFISNFIVIHPVGSTFFSVWTDRWKLIFGNFVNVPKNSCYRLVTEFLFYFSPPSQT